MGDCRDKFIMSMSMSMKCKCDEVLAVLVGGRLSARSSHWSNRSK